MDALRNVLNKKDANGNFVLAPLPYTDDYLEPYIGERTVRFHYWKHLKAYIDKVNALKVNFPSDTSFEEILRVTESFDNDLYKNASQVYNHYFYFAQLNAKGTKRPLEQMQKLIEQTYGSLEQLKVVMTDAAMSIFGSGWVYLVKGDNDKLSVITYTGTGTPRNFTRIIALDVWEHAYYLDYQNNRRLYVEKFFEAIDWLVVERRLSL